MQNATIPLFVEHVFARHNYAQQSKRRQHEAVVIMSDTTYNQWQTHCETTAAP